jgi:hypothetical protein
MEAPVHRVIIFALALRAHLEAAHGGLGTVIGYILDDGETRAAIGAIGKWITIAPILGIKYLFQTGLAGSDIGRDKLIPTLFSDAMTNLEISIALGLMAAYGDILQPSQRRRHSYKVIKKSLQGMLLPLDLDLDIARGVANPAL